MLTKMRCERGSLVVGPGCRQIELWCAAGFRSNLAEQACLAFARAAERKRDDGQRQRLLRLAVESLDEGRMDGFAGVRDPHLAELSRHDPGLLREYQNAIDRINRNARADRAALTGTSIGLHAFVPVTDDWLANRDEARGAWSQFEAVLARIRARTGLDLTNSPLRPRQSWLASSIRVKQSLISYPMTQMTVQAVI